MSTANYGNEPDNEFGWGIIDVFSALYYNNPDFSYTILCALSNPYPNPFNSIIQFDIHQIFF